VIQREQVKTYELEFKTTQIEPKDIGLLILNESIVVDVYFDAARGFTFSFDELNIYSLPGQTLAVITSSLLIQPPPNNVWDYIRHIQRIRHGLFRPATASALVFPIISLLTRFFSMISNRFVLIFDNYERFR